MTMKKLMTALFASVLALALAAPAASACPEHDTKVAKEQDEPGVIAQEGKADKAGEPKQAEAAPKAEKKEQPKVAKASKKQQKKPIRVSQK
jgi:hypothetical protein